MPERKLLVVSEAVQLEREKRKTRRENRLMDFVTDPQMMGLITLIGGLYVAQRIPYSEDPERNDLVRGVATGGVVLAALSRSGLGGWQALAAAGITTSATVGGDKPPIQLDWSGFWKNITGGK
jgi:hypothetical protein